MSETAQKALLREFREDRWAAHRHLFRHRHPEGSPDAHRELVEHINRPVARLLIEGFRGFAKSTYLEETAVLRAGFREFHFMVLLGSSYDRACDRLAAVKREFEINPLVQKLFGELKGEVWQTGQIVLTNGLCIRALGRDQSMTGMKYLDHRPDAALIDDLEDPDEVRTDPERARTWDWVLKTFLPSLDDPILTWIRALATRRGNGSMPERMEKRGWITVKFPIEYIDGEGERRATWPAKFWLEKIDEMKLDYVGDMDTWMQEYMCEAVSASDRVFKREMLRVVPRARQYEPVYAMYDPARTIGARSATTGRAVWSWVRNRLVVWECMAGIWLPDQLIADLFDVNERYGPVWIGVEEDGLNEWIRQPLRHEQVRRGMAAPVRPLRAPRGKLDFIRGLQPFFAAGEVEFAVPMPELETQLLSFPYGKIDAPNALAYALTLRPGAPIYDGFTQDHIAESLSLDRGRPLWLALNATRGLVTAAAMQYGMGRTRILADWAIESEPAEAIPLLMREAGMMFRMTATASVGGAHYDRYLNTGLVQACQRVPVEVERGTEPARGRVVMRDELARMSRGFPALQVAWMAKLTLNALSGGYARMLGRGGQLGDEAEPGIYRVLMEGVEACLGRMASVEEIDDNMNWFTTPDGRRYQRYGSVTQRR